jgi:hypothetical protein
VIKIAFISEKTNFLGEMLPKTKTETTLLYRKISKGHGKDSRYLTEKNMTAEKNEKFLGKTPKNENSGISFV